MRCLLRNWGYVSVGQAGKEMCKTAARGCQLKALKGRERLPYLITMMVN